MNKKINKEDMQNEALALNKYFDGRDLCVCERMFVCMVAHRTYRKMMELDDEKEDVNV